MANLQKYFYNEKNLLNNESIIITPTTTSSSDKQVVVQPIQKQGNGSLLITGDYTGENDKEFILNISNETPDNADIFLSKNIFEGAGNGELKIIEAKNLDTQKIELTCIETGLETQTATINLFGLTFLAKPTGSEGNSVNLKVINNMSYTDSGFVTPTKLLKNTNNIQDQSWELPFFKEITANTPLPECIGNGGVLYRISFECDPFNIYLVWSESDAFGNLTLKFSQDIQGYIPVNNKIYFVSGGRNVEISDGSITQTLLNIKTIYDFHNQLIDLGDDIALIYPENKIIENIRKFGQYAIIEFNLTTEQHYSSAYLEIAEDKWEGLSDIIINENTEKETITISLNENKEWDVVGSVSGNLGIANVGDYFTHFRNSDMILGIYEPYLQFFMNSFLDVFIQENPNENMAWNYEFVPVDQIPGFCFYANLGINARSMTVTLTYKDVTASCDCTSYNFSDDCLGLIPEGGGETQGMYIPINLVDWTQSKYEDMKQKWEDVDTTTSFDIFDSKFSIFYSIAAKIFSLITTDETRILNLAALYKVLVLTVEYREYFDASNHELMTYDDDNDVWITTLLPIQFVGQDTDYDIDLKKRIIDEYLDYHSQYHQKKNSIIGSDCYQEDPNPTQYWEVSVGGILYKHAYTDLVYYSHTQLGNGDLHNTMEFGFFIETPCSSFFSDGDKIVLTILGSNPTQNEYTKKQKIYLNLFPNENKKLEGGISGTDKYVFKCEGEESFGNIDLPFNSDVNLLSDKLKLNLSDGNIPYQNNDKFIFYVEGGHYRYNDGTTIYPEKSIKNISQNFENGLNILFSQSVYKSFYKSDIWKIKCEQTNKQINMKKIDDVNVFKGTFTINIDLLTSQDVDSLILDFHTIPSGETITLEASNDNFVSTIYSTIINSTQIIYKIFDTVNARYWRILSSYVSEVKIGYLFLGTYMQLDMEARIQKINTWIMRRSSGQNQHNVYDYKKQGYSVKYSNGFVRKSDFDKVVEMMDYIKSNNDGSIYFMPSSNHDFIMKGKIEDDKLEPTQPIPETAPDNYKMYKFDYRIVGDKRE